MIVLDTVRCYSKNRIISKIRINEKDKYKYDNMI